LFWREVQLRIGTTLSELRRLHTTMRIEIAKRADGSGVLRCTRHDGTIAWQKQPKHGAHFALHDLTHFAVETSLGYSRGFFGLIASGWEFADIGGKGPRGPLPPEALEVERLVGIFDSERACNTLWTTEHFNAFSLRPLTHEEIAKVRAARAKLFRKWLAVSLGGNRVLEYKPAPTPVK